MKAPALQTSTMTARATMEFSTHVMNTLNLNLTHGSLAMRKPPCGHQWARDLCVEIHDAALYEDMTARGQCEYQLRISAFAMFCVERLASPADWHVGALGIMLLHSMATAFMQLDEARLQPEHWKWLIDLGVGEALPVFAGQSDQ